MSDTQPPGWPGGPPSEPLPPELDPRTRRAAHARPTKESARVAAASKGRAHTRALRRDVARGAILSTKILAALLSLTVVVGSYWVWNTWSSFNKNIAVGDPINPTVTISGKSNAPTKDIDGPDQNILLLGNDSRDGATPAELAALNTGDDGGSANTDTMMLMHVPGNGKDATVVSFPRDSYVAIPGHGMAKLNAAYPDGYSAAKAQGQSEVAAESAGVNLLGQTLQQLTGLTIDHYIQINLLGFYRISNAIGGVPVLLCEPAKETNSGINLSAGLTKIQGTQALAFVRQRYGFADGQGDLDRIKRQQYFLKSVFHTLTSSGALLNPLTVQNLLKAVSSSLLTDGVNLLNLADTFSAMAEGSLTFQTIPDDGFGENGAGSVVLITPSKVQAFVQNLIGKTTPAAISTAPTVAPGSFTVTVLNASNGDGVATKNADALTAAGFKAVVGDNPSGTVTATEIDYPATMVSQAKTLLAQIPGASLVQSAQVSTVTLKLGTDGQQVKGLAGSSTSSSAGTSSTPSSSAANVPIGTGVPNVPNQPGCIN